MDHRPPEPPAPVKEKKTPPPSVEEGGFKDTLESILVAFMLAFIFRAFIVEAFVIPTGSMAPTLLGAHMRYRCPDCGYHFDANFQGTEGSGDDVIIPKSAQKKVFAIFCPNCGYRLPRFLADDPENDVNDPAVRYGDRILVLKHLYIFKEPSRWDVVVFKSPYDPGKYDYAQNYIKRLVGLPGETIMVLDGDVYVSTDPSHAPETFTVQTKPRRVQEALWRIIHDSDYASRGLDRSIMDPYGKPVGSDPPYEQPWKPQPGETGWTPSANGRMFKFANTSGGATLAFDANANPAKHAMTDWLGYDVTDQQGGETDSYDRNSYEPDNNVSDVKLSFEYIRTDGQGPLRIRLTKAGHEFESVIGAADASLFMDGALIAGPTPISLHSGGSQIEMSNVDYRVSLLVDGHEIFATTPDQFHPDILKLLAAFNSPRQSQDKATVEIAAENQTCELAHVNLWRDVYYLNRNRGGGDPLRWANPSGYPGEMTRLMNLGADEFFVMGDNSLVSLDARYWTDPINLPGENLSAMPGRVPRRFMLGRAFFVYWPAGYRPLDIAPAIAPNFGDMRFIH
jgi:signal peptidase I